MKELLNRTLLTIFLTSCLNAQSPDTLWTKIFGGIYSDWGYSVQQTTDGGYIITGSTESFGAGFDDVWLIKTNGSGDALWTKTIGGSSDDRGYSVQQTTDGGYIIAGMTESFGAGFDDVWLIKTNDSGDTLWTKTFGGNYSEWSNSVQQTSDGGYIIAGKTSSFSTGISDVWLIKTNDLGDTLWAKTYGGVNGDAAWSVQQTKDGGYLIIATTLSFGAGFVDTWLLKTDDSGDTLWTKTFGGISDDWCGSVQQTTDGGYIISGWTESFGAGSNDGWLIKTDDSGDTLWTKTYGGTSSDVFSWVQQTSDGGYIITGYTESFGAGSEDGWLIKVNDSGDTIWTKTIGGSSQEFCSSVEQTKDGGYIITGIKNTGNSWDIWLLKTAPDLSNIIADNEFVFSDFSLQQNYPNPFNPSTVIYWQVPVGSHQTLKIYDVLGNEVVTLVDEYKPAGNYEIEWNATGLPSGVYFYRLHAGDFVETKKMLLMK